MSEATLVYPHQLFKNSPAIKKGRKVYLVEESLILSHNPIHRQKLLFHKLSLDTFEQRLKKDGYEVIRITIQLYPVTQDVFSFLKDEGVTRVHVVDTTDFYLEQALVASEFERVWYESPLFILTKEEAVGRYKTSKRFMAKFYKQLRIDKAILMEADGAPTGGQWSFDADNRKKIPKEIMLPQDIALSTDAYTKKDEQWVASVSCEQYGELGCWLPLTHEGAEDFLHEFLQERFDSFGKYEDAMTVRGTRLFHSTLSPLLNVGLLTPMQVIETALTYAEENNVPINSLEGFVRQILGWREFIRAAYESDHVAMRTQNFWKHHRTLPAQFWYASTSIGLVDEVIKKALQFGYNHHIERLMILGNFMLLNQIHPDEVYRWFMAMYIDAYDWVMVPNVYGMSQFADGGIFATKPYISGSNYIKKMSDYKGGEWEIIWTALYWNFVSEHRDFFEKNHRLSMMPRMLDKLSTEKKKLYNECLDTFNAKLFPG